MYNRGLQNIQNIHRIHRNIRQNNNANKISCPKPVEISSSCEPVVCPDKSKLKHPEKSCNS